MSKLRFSKRDNYSRCKNSALYSLAMREHSRKEIYNKLKRKDFSEGVDLTILLDELEERDYLSEERFVESFIRYQSNRGQGSNKITNELTKRGVNQFLISKAFCDAKLDWFALAKVQYQKKFGKTKPADFKEKAKQMRFLSSRGFDLEIIRQVVG
jgi:regulatory protein